MGGAARLSKAHVRVRHCGRVRVEALQKRARENVHDGDPTGEYEIEPLACEDACANVALWMQSFKSLRTTLQTPIKSASTRT